MWVNDKEIAGNSLDDDKNGFIDDKNGWDFITNKPNPSPKFSPGWTEDGISHGTMIAGIIAAVGNNHQGVAGVTWKAKIMPLRVLDDKGEGKLSDVIRAVDYAVNNGADIINLSFVSFNYSEAMQAAIRRAYQAGVIVVAAAGNEQSAGNGYDIDKTPIYPACYDGANGENMVLGVAATDALDQKAKFSSYGFSCVDIAAPGVSFFSTITQGGNPADTNRIYDGFWSGTSMAAPMISGTIALIEEINPELNRQEVIDILFNSADNIYHLNPNYLGQLGHGRVNVALALEMAREKLFNRSGKILISPFKNSNKLEIVNSNGAIFKELSLAEKKNLALIAGDVNGDGADEIIAAPEVGTPPLIRIYNQSGKLSKEFLAYDKNFRGGLSLASADVDGDGQDEIIAIAASGGTSQLKIFNNQGQLKKQFFVDSKTYRGGFNIAAGNIDGFGNAEIIVAYGAGAKPLLKMFNFTGKLQGQFMPYESKFRGGVKVAVGNIDGRNNHNKQEIIVSPGPGAKPIVKVYDNHAQLKWQFSAYNSNWQGGVSVAAGDLNNDGRAEIITAAYPGAAPHVRTFNDKGELLESFYAYEEKFTGGVNVGFIRINN
ncbi:MAG: S8 family serine peptidase [Candidatus Falkowbacteria bacterium]|nr:S8 family serine peptidase [Candidatus Falkowbacteria bacterium]